MKKFIMKHTGKILFISILLISAFLHGYNMFNFPQYEGDEGTYISQAWSVIEQGELAPYTYWYDHPPLGWVFMAGFVKVFFGGNFFAFGTSVDTMRILILVLHVLSTAFIFIITTKATKNKFAAFLASFLYIVSPLEIYFQRGVWLDNIMIFWILASALVLSTAKLKLRHYIASGSFFAIAVLTKITAVMFGFPLLVYALLRGCKIPTIFRVSIWLMAAAAITGTYLLYAAINGELLPATNGEHVSFIETLRFQAGRGGSSTVHFWESGSNLSLTINDWIKKDPWFVKMGALLVGFSLFVSIYEWIKNRNKEFVFFVLALIFYSLFLIRGGIILNFYILPLLPFVVMTVATMIHSVLKAIFDKEYIHNIIISILIVAIGFFYIVSVPLDYSRTNDNIHYRNSTKWVKESLPEDTVLAVGNHVLIDLWSDTYINNKSFKNADWYYKIDKDAEIRDNKYHKDWKNIDYIVMSYSMINQIFTTNNHHIVKQALLNSRPVIGWIDTKYSILPKNGEFATKVGSWVIAYKVFNKHYEKLDIAWSAYKAAFVDNKEIGRVSSEIKDETTSEGQSYAMLRSAWVEDKKTFYSTWKWTKENMYASDGDVLFAWKWEHGKISSMANATDADEDIALSLLFGYKLWDDKALLKEARQIIDGIWKKTVVDINGTLYLLPMYQDIAEQYVQEDENVYLLNPSYFSPAHYRIFAQVDENKAHDWERLAQDSYKILNRIGTMKNNNIYLPPDWIVVGKNTGKLASASPYLGKNTDIMSYDAFRIIWRVALDHNWFNTTEAKEYLILSGAYLLDQYNTNLQIPASINLDGTHQGHTGIAQASVYSYALRLHDKNIANKYFKKSLTTKYNKNTHMWIGAGNYYENNWVWFGYGLYNNALSNIWSWAIYKSHKAPLLPASSKK